MNAIIEIPEGYRLDAKGRLIPSDQVKAIDIERSDLVERLIKDAQQLQQQMLAFKKLSFEDIAAFIQLSAEQHGVHLGGNKGNVTLFSFDGKYKIVRQSQESIRFDESLQAAKALIDECISEWAADSNDNIQVLINDAFQVDKEGKISTGRVLSLRRLDIRDEKWLRAMDAISDSIIVTDSKNYIRFYQRDEDGKYQAISLDFANV
ncbi:sulfate transporter [Acinetobacter sp. ANC 4558]|uniref:DUF3164 family protein n=1 Tax=Acinetobacter sp. ANC 4558 TaxID=1977876 RepID=UPI000A3513EA|nr:DUF3164 family protein [Acinetobacter sp. ANC 4558]OTG87677.1 sulfate transporter [Acinetobacter sp. ANC 4558]